MDTTPRLPEPTPASTTPTPPNPGWKIGLMVIGIVIMFVGILLTAVVTRISATKKAEAKKVATAVIATQKATATQPVIIKVGKQPILYKFSDYADGCVSLKIEVYDFYWYPKGGRVTVFPPKGEPFVDTPGVNIKTHLEPGVWKWSKKDSDTWGIEVWQ